MKVGFIGLGVMGSHMAGHLLRDHEVSVFDIDPARLQAMRDSGARIAGGGQDAATDAECVLLSLPSSEVVRDVVAGPDGIMHVMKKQSCVIDTSTTAPNVSQEVAASLQELGVNFLDAPVSGGEGGARDATLAIMVGGRPEVFDTYRPVLESIGKTVTLLGGTGAGGVAKLVNNMIVGVTFAVIAEGFALGKECDLDLKVLYEAIRGGWAGSNVLDVAAPGIIGDDFEPGGSVDIHFKDMSYALSLGSDRNVPTPMTALAQEIFKAARATGRGPKAQQVIFKLWEDLGIGSSQ